MPSEPSIGESVAPSIEGAPSTWGLFSPPDELSEAAASDRSPSVVPHASGDDTTSAKSAIPRAIPRAHAGNMRASLHDRPEYSRRPRGGDGQRSFAIPGAASVAPRWTLQKRM